ncbi:MAG: hypothetical protein ACOCV4_09320, partial [Myxococcota bacterium]
LAAGAAANPAAAAAEGASAGDVEPGPAFADGAGTLLGHEGSGWDRAASASEEGGLKAEHGEEKGCAERMTPMGRVHVTSVLSRGMPARFRRAFADEPSATPCAS